MAGYEGIPVGGVAMKETKEQWKKYVGLALIGSSKGWRPVDSRENRILIGKHDK